MKNMIKKRLVRQDGCIFRPQPECTQHFIGIAF